MAELDGIRSLLFVDEVKNALANNDPDNSFYYFAVVVPMGISAAVRVEVDVLTRPLRGGFHASKWYSSKKMDLILMEAMTGVLVRHGLHCLIYRYDRDKLFDYTLKHIQRHVADEEIAGRLANWEFQAFFHFVQTLQQLPERRNVPMAFPFLCFFDRGLFGVKEIEGLDFSVKGIMERAVFSSRKEVSTLALPDHLGYLFSQCRKLFIGTALGKDLNRSLSGSAYGQQLLRLVKPGLFHYVEAEQWFSS